MAEIIRLLVPFITGMLLGTAYFNGLWHTVRRLPESRQPLASLFLSFLLRASLALAGFYFVMNGRWEQLVAALLGFILAREIMVRRLGRITSRP